MKNSKSDIISSGVSADENFLPPAREKCNVLRKRQSDTPLIPSKNAQNTPFYAFYAARGTRTPSIVGFVLIIAVLAFPAYASEIDLQTIRSIESSGNAFAISSKGCRGLYQISDIARRDYNEQTKSNITPTDLFNPEVNKKISIWLFNKRIPSLLRHFKKPITTENILISYNCGVGCVGKPLPNETKKYLTKYKTRGKL